MNSYETHSARLIEQATDRLLAARPDLTRHAAMTEVLRNDPLLYSEACRAEQSAAPIRLAEPTMAAPAKDAVLAILAQRVAMLRQAKPHRTREQLETEVLLADPALYEKFTWAQAQDRATTWV